MERPIVTYKMQKSFAYASIVEVMARFRQGETQQLWLLSLLYPNYAP